MKIFKLKWKWLRVPIDESHVLQLDNYCFKASNMFTLKAIAVVRT